MNKRGKNKKGSHVGMILSFIIFVTFIVFLYIVVQPALKGGEDKRAFLESLKLAMFANVSANFTSASVRIDDGVDVSGKNCVSFKRIFGSDGLIEIEDPKLIVKDEDENSLNYKLSGAGATKDLNVERLSRDDKFFKIYESPVYFLNNDASVSGCTPLDSSSYTLGLVTVNEYIFNKSIHALEDSYNKNYEQVKEQLKVPVQRDFGFSFRNSKGEKEFGVGEEVVFTSVYAEEIPIQYMDDEANILAGFINLRVW